MKLKKTIGIIATLACTWGAAAEEPLELTLAEAIARAQQHSPEAQSARHTYLAAYWNYRFYRANYLPSVTLSAAPELNHQINRITQSDGTERFLNQNQLNSDLTLTVNQNVWFTGGSLFATSSVRRMDVLDNHTYSYNTNPITIGYRQSLFGYNSLKWDRRTEPLAYREACKAYAESLELVAAQTCNLFFMLASAQAERDIAESNYASADTLFRYAEGRYRIGTITKNEMLQLEINKLNEEANLLDAQTAVEDATQELRSFLGLAQTVPLEVVPEHHIPQIEVPVGQALELAYAYSPDPEAHQRQLVEGKSNLARAKANAGLKRPAGRGLSQTAQPTIRQPVALASHPGLGARQGAGARGAFPTGPDGNPGGPAAARLRAERGAHGAPVQSARSPRGHRTAHRQHGATTQRSGAPALPARQVHRARLERLGVGKGCRPAQLHPSPATVLGSLLRPAQPDTV